MAEALAAAHRRDPEALIVGIIGRGHLEYGHGIPHQLADLGIDDVGVLLPVDADDDCAAHCRPTWPTRSSWWRRKWMNRCATSSSRCHD